MQQRIPGANLYRIERRHARLTEAERVALADDTICPLSDEELEFLARKLKTFNTGRGRRD